MTEEVLVGRNGGVVTATFNRPESRNALTFATYDALAALCEDIDVDATVGALVVTGAGREAFAAGTDIAQFEAFTMDADALA